LTNKYTAVVRKKPSLPCRILNKHSLLIGKMLDYGCGRCFDAKYYGMDAFDPNWNIYNYINKPSTYDTIVCNYVLNVVTPLEEEVIIDHIYMLLKTRGNAYFTVRRDLKRDAQKGRGCIQRMVYLPLESIHRTSAFEIYRMKV